MSRGNRFTLVPVVLATALFASPAANAFPGCDSFFAAAYPNSTTENLGGCQTCHQGQGGNMNVYGRDLLANADAAAGSVCSLDGFAAAARAVENADSDGEGNTNLVEINANTQPGWCDTTLNPTCTNSGATPPNTTLDPVPANGIPVANPGGPYNGEAGVTLIQFDGSGSSDPDDDPLTITVAGLPTGATFDPAGRRIATLASSKWIWLAIAARSGSESSPLFGRSCSRYPLIA